MSLVEMIAANGYEMAPQLHESPFAVYDVRARAQVPVDTSAGLCAIYAGLVDAPQASEMVDRYRARRATGAVRCGSTSTGCWPADSRTWGCAPRRGCSRMKRWR